ncbi:M23 family metallopeptidase [Polymorphobacter fuscus]|uniref:Peptidoglycan DD-metalloendopeptidase family protein n=1 Tax=Sandarakinorhabdus fusca TaxID=1439888 RepID=A0A7C9GS80_9SPHN|nr:M23 family metallopeptidase [Polymorphobacter fuscus]KAB7646450.1 M23 family metallopeptidase [Polymorphobacter fuscus]MQT17691.1 peptidoglycan DD-metalloendopeptidase family protein [Polymorphobacter fuscus]NJC09763.1 murein DD-endopeptidase MepM/ murein hydrolase activator NlpD [Polymorphobacter fuscus]
MAIGSAVLVAGWLGAATSSLLSGNDAVVAAKQAEVARLHKQVVAMKAETAALKGDVAARAEALESRQAFLTALLSNKGDLGQLARMLPRQSRTSGPSNLDMVRDLVAPQAAKRGKRGTVLAALPAPDTNRMVEPFRQLESQQLALVDKATGAAQAKLQDTQALIRRLGLDPSRFVASSDWNGATSAVGGPYIPVSADAEPRFKDLFLSWKKLNAMQSAVAAIPAYMPVKDYRYTSGFGVRYDPFNGGAAMHAGTDMAGAQGEPIYAAASGMVRQAGRANGYGNLVELSHGKGIDTRYGHLSAILVKPGERVVQGQLIGRMGSTGRSTGTHLHYEVRIDGRAVNPRPFLEASSYVLAAQNSGTAVGGDVGPVLEDDVVTASNDGPRMTPIRSFR